MAMGARHGYGRWARQSALGMARGAGNGRWGRPVPGHGNERWGATVTMGQRGRGTLSVRAAGEREPPFRSLRWRGQHR